MRWTDSTASLAEGAICRARGEVRFDGVERTDFHTLVAGDARGLNFSFGRAEEVAQGENGATGTDVLTPESPAKHAEKQNSKEE